MPLPSSSTVISTPHFLFFLLRLNVIFTRASQDCRSKAFFSAHFFHLSPQTLCKPIGFAIFNKSASFKNSWVIKYSFSPSTKRKGIFIGFSSFFSFKITSTTVKPFHQSLKRFLVSLYLYVSFSM